MHGPRRTPDRPDRPGRATWRRDGRRLDAVLCAALERIAPHARGFHSAVALFLLIGLGLVLLAAWGIAALADLVTGGEPLWLDRNALLWIDRHATPWLDAAALEITALGSAVVAYTVVLVASALLWSWHDRAPVFMLWAALIGGLFLNTSLKLIIGRPRPRVFEWRVQYIDSPSFPSGHAMTAAVVYATLAYLIIRLDPSPFVRGLTIALAVLIIALVGLSRLYLGVHYPTDVLGGYAVGFAWAALCAFGLRALYQRRTRNAAPPERDERDVA